MLIKYIIILYIITPDYNYSLSIRKDIEFAKQFLKYHGISDENVCVKKYIEQVCSNDQKEVCSARLLGKKMEFKQFDNPCYMDFNNFCDSQDNIWAIKNPGPCVVNDEMRRFAKEIEKIAVPSPEIATDDDIIDDTTRINDEVTDETTYETTTDETEFITESTDETEFITESTDETEFITESTDETEFITESTDETEFITESTDETESVSTDETESTTETTYESTIDETVTVASTIKMTGDENLRMGEEIGNIVYNDGSKLALRQENSTRFPPMKGILTYKEEPCEKYVKPCPNLYFPVCLYYERENPDNVTYFYFINSCEARQWTCYHPERT
ncbi:uncharacterized protein LOC134802401 isoform X2 [Cydia splendana]|uniref:uncharacterized protein LOC134802401 isoform X2 n=1 Tax=Cydia splendana TaxID=1100963 RepID=UPI00300D64FD